MRDNIARFGGDSSKIIAWGESAGAIAVDYLDFAYFLDPIVSGRIMASGTALFAPQYQRQSADFAHTNFIAVSKALGCGRASSQVECLRNVSWQEIEGYLATAEAQTIKFLPVTDENLIFSNYSRRYDMNALSAVPAIIGTNRYELNALAMKNASTEYEKDLAALTDSSFLCTASATSRFREASSRMT